MTCLGDFGGSFETSVTALPATKVKCNVTWPSMHMHMHIRPHCWPLKHRAWTTKTRTEYQALQLSSVWKVDDDVVDDVSQSRLGPSQVHLVQTATVNSCVTGQVPPVLTDTVYSCVTGHVRPVISVTRQACLVRTDTMTACVAGGTVRPQQLPARAHTITICCPCMPSWTKRAATQLGMVLLELGSAS